MGNQICQATEEQKQFRKSHRVLSESSKSQSNVEGARKEVSPNKPHRVSFKVDNNEPRQGEQDSKMAISHEQIIPKIPEDDKNSKSHMERQEKLQSPIKMLEKDDINENLSAVSNRSRKSNLSTVKVQRSPQSRQNKLDCGSPQKVVKLNFEDIYLKHVESGKQEGNLQYQPITVPFSVIEMLMKDQLKQNIKKDNPDFFKKNQRDSTAFRLYKDGFYANLMPLSDQAQKSDKQSGLKGDVGYGVFINSEFFYQGNYILQTDHESGFDRYLPYQRGTFLTSNSIYKGQFENGKVHGKGKYSSLNESANNVVNLNRSQNKENTNPLSNNQPQAETGNTFFSNQNAPKKQTTVYEGEWENGLLVKGTVQNDLFKFEGELSEHKPSGYGKVFYKSSSVTYQGHFVDGKFHDQGTASYECHNFSYSGSFKNGKRHGFGALNQKLTSVKNPKGKLRVEEKYEGRWDNDQLVERLSFAEYKQKYLSKQRAEE